MSKFKVGQKVWIKESDGFRWLALVLVQMSMPGKYFVEDQTGHQEIVSEANMVKPLVKASKPKKKAKAKRKPAKKAKPRRAKAKVKRSVMRIGARAR